VDVKQEINTVDRVVGTRTIDAGEAQLVVLTRTYDTTVDDLWDACTNPERIPRWFLPVTGELKVGGQYQLEGNANGTIESCDPPHSFTATWEFDNKVSWIELRLSESGSGAQFELTHIHGVADDHWRQFGPGAVGLGYELALMGLGLHLTSGEAQDPQAAMAWMGSDEGKEFLIECSDRWRAAHVAGGEDAETARASAERTTAAYTGAES
jgi:uncharacterized protein YndB with AHSA1/START domain